MQSIFTSKRRQSLFPADFSFNNMDPKINNATPKLAPDEIPRTKGPAKGFLNKVCINNPLTANPEPTIIAVRALGNRKFKTINSQLDFDASPHTRISKTSENVMETEPKFIFMQKNRSRVIPKPKN